MKRFIVRGLIVSMLGFIPFYLYAENASEISKKVTIINKSQDNDKKSDTIENAIKQEYINEQQRDIMIQQNSSTQTLPKR